MVEEISENYDGNSSSQYFYKPQDSISGKIYAGPAWDYDSTFGSYAAKHNAKYVLNPESLWIAKGDKTAWYPALYRHEDFRQKVAELWQEKARPAVEVLLGKREAGETGMQSIDRLAKSIEDSAAMDRQRWPRPDVSSTVAQTGGSFSENVRFLKNYLEKRYHFLNGEWGGGK